MNDTTENAALADVPSTGWLGIDRLDRSEMQFVLVTDCDTVRLRLWNPHQNRWEPEPPRFGPLTDADDCCEPTHFMPLPDLPNNLAETRRQGE